jgi:hypothetical protein
MAMNVKILAAVAGALLGLAFIFYVVSNTVPIWYVKKSTHLSKFYTKNYNDIQNLRYFVR